MFVLDGEIVTPPLGDSVLAGVTRDSLIQLAPRLGMQVVERPGKVLYQDELQVAVLPWSEHTAL